MIRYPMLYTCLIHMALNYRKNGLSETKKDYQYILFESYSRNDLYTFIDLYGKNLYPYTNEKTRHS